MIRAKDIIQELENLNEGFFSSILDKLRTIGKHLFSREVHRTSDKPIYIPHTDPEIYDSSTGSPELFFSFIIDFKNQLDSSDWNTASEASLVAPSKWVDSLYDLIEKLTKEPYHLNDKVTDGTYILFYLSVYGTSEEQIYSIYNSLVIFFEKTCNIRGKIPKDLKKESKGL